MKVWIVTTANCEGYSALSLTVHASRDSAAAKWHEVNTALIAEAQEGVARETFSEMYDWIATELRAGTPDEPADSVHDHPVMFEREVL